MTGEAPPRHAWVPSIRGLGPLRDASLSALLVVQAFTQLVALPLEAAGMVGHALFEVGHLTFAALCALTLTRRRVLRAVLLALLVAVGSPVTTARVGAALGAGADFSRVMGAGLGLVFNAIVAALVARRVFGPGEVTTHRVQGAVLVYLNVATLFAIGYDLLEMHATGAIRPSAGGTLAGTARGRTAELWYFSLATLTTTGYGDIVPVHPLARGLANAEALFGQLFPATLLARLVALHLAHGNTTGDDE